MAQKPEDITTKPINKQHLPKNYSINYTNLKKKLTDNTMIPTTHTPVLSSADITRLYPSNDPTDQTQQFKSNIIIKCVDNTNYKYYNAIIEINPQKASERIIDITLDSELPDFNIKKYKDLFEEISLDTPDICKCIYKKDISDNSINKFLKNLLYF